MSLPYRAVQISIVLARARVGASWEVRDGMPEMADKAECAFTLGVTRDKPNCGHPRYKSVNKSTSYNSAFTGTVFQETTL